MKELQLYLHVPFCVRKCDYCDFLSFSCGRDVQEAYVSALLKEIAFYGQRNRDAVVTTIYIGGGTPTCLRPQEILRLMDTVRESFAVAENAEISMECNPGTEITEEGLCIYRKAGINRLSIGLQSTDDEELKLLGRIHKYEDFLCVYMMARKVGFDNINVDLISGIPYQDEKKFETSLKRILRLKPDHISAYTLIVEPGTPFYERYQEDVRRQEEGEETHILPNEEVTCNIYRRTGELLAEAGYEQYEISNYAKKGRLCRHNLGYWTGKEYLGLGLGASSYIEEMRFSNETDLAAYLRIAEMFKEAEKSEKIEKAEKKTSPWVKEVTSVGRREQMEEFMFLGLRVTQGIERKEFERRFDIPIEAIYGNVLPRLQSQGLLRMYEGRIALTEEGIEVSNYVLSHFLLDEK